MVSKPHVGPKYCVAVSLENAHILPVYAVLFKMLHIDPYGVSRLVFARDLKLVRLWRSVETTYSQPLSCNHLITLTAAVVSDLT